MSGCSHEQTTDEPAPSLHTHYRCFITTTSWSASAAASVLDVSQFLLLDALPLAPAPLAGSEHGIGTRLPTFRVVAADQTRAAFTPDTAWPINGHPPSSSRDKGHTPVLMPSISFDTSTANRLRSPSRSLPSASRALFPHRSPRSRHRSRSMWRFEASPRRATSKGQHSFISHTAPHQQAPPTSNSPLCS